MKTQYPETRRDEKMRQATARRTENACGISTAKVSQSAGTCLSASSTACGTAARPLRRSALVASCGGVSTTSRRGKPLDATTARPPERAETRFGAAHRHRGDAGLDR